jgi:hypothetical protein
MPDVSAADAFRDRHDARDGYTAKQGVPAGWSDVPGRGARNIRGIATLTLRDTRTSGGCNEDRPNRKRAAAAGCAVEHQRACTRRRSRGRCRRWFQRWRHRGRHWGRRRARNERTGLWHIDAGHKHQPGFDRSQWSAAIRAAESFGLLVGKPARNALSESA